MLATGNVLYLPCNFPFISNANEISRPKLQYPSKSQPDHMHFRCITCTLCSKIYIGEAGRTLGECFREHLRDVKIDNKDAS